GNVVEILAEHWVVAPISLKDLVTVHDLLNFFKTPAAERGRNERQRRGPLRSIEFPHAKARPANRSYRKVGPPRTLLFVVKCKQDALPLLLIEGRNESLGSAHDSRGCRLRHGGAHRQKNQCQHAHAIGCSHRQSDHLLFSFSAASIVIHLL